MPPREIVSLQLGSYANFVGAHFWNFQDEILGLTQGQDDSAACAAEMDLDVLNRVGESKQGGISCHPRVVILDLKGSSGSLALQRDGAAHNHAFLQSLADTPSVSTWGGATHSFVSDPVPQTAFLQSLYAEEEYEPDAGASLEDQMETEEEGEDVDAHDPMVQAAAGLEHQVEYWSDYLKAVLHHRSVYELPGLWQGVATFDGFGDGASVMGSQETGEEVADRVRHFAEECDHLQGFHVLSETRSGFGSTTEHLLTHLRDEFARRPIFLFDVAPPRAPSSTDQAAAPAPNPSLDTNHGESLISMAPEDVAQASTKRKWQLNSVLATAQLTQHADLYIPMNLSALAPALRPHISLRDDNAFHTSAMYASALDSATTAYRLHTFGCSQSSSGAPSVRAPPAQGRTSMHELARVLKSQGGPPLTSMSIAFPAPEVPWMKAVGSHGHRCAGEDERMQKRHAAAPDDSLALDLASSLVSLSEGVAACPSEMRARVLAMRGGRRQGGAVDPAHVAQALQASLARGPLCMRHWVAHAQPLPIPVSFPPVFAPSVLRHGDMQEAGLPRAGGGVVSAPVLSQLATTSAFSQQLHNEAKWLKSAKRSAQGTKLLQSWGYDAGEIEEVSDRLHTLIKECDNVGSSDFSD